VILLLIIPQNPLKNMLRCLYPFPKTQHDLITNYSQNPFQKAQRDLAYQLFNGSLKKTQVRKPSSIANVVHAWNAIDVRSKVIHGNMHLCVIERLVMT
jgi:hypothetical protein